MSTCTIEGYIKDGSEVPIEGVMIQFIPAAIPAIDSSTGVALYPVPIECYTSSTGYFSADLIINTDFIVIINSIGMKERIRIPAETTYNLFYLTGGYTPTGDATPTDTGQDNW
jgi:hypothetical protein